MAGNDSSRSNISSHQQAVINSLKAVITSLKTDLLFYSQKKNKIKT